MKLRYLFSVLPLCVAFMFAGCGVTAEDLTKNHLAELQNNFFVGTTQNFKVSLWSGTREEPYEPNGELGELVDFCIISVVPVGDVNTFGLNYTVEVNDMTYNGEFEKSPFDNSLAADIGVSVEDTDTIYAYIIMDGVSEVGKLECVSSGFAIKNTDALNIVVDNFGENILTLSNNGEIPVEAYCKIISTDKNLGVYFWYVRVVNAEGQDISVVIDPNSGEIIAKKL